jgi:hypothetical protein
MRRFTMKIKWASVTAIVAAALGWFPCSGHAALDDWGWGFANASNLQTGGTTAFVGVTPTACDGYDSSDRLSGVVPDLWLYVRAYHVNGEDGWDGNTGYYSKDYRAPMPLTAGLSKTWLVYVWGNTTLPEEATYNGYMRLGWLRSANPPNQLHFTITLTAKPSGITGGPATGTVWDLSAQPDGGVQLPVFRTDNGLEGYVFEFTATVIPEPSSLLALTAGIGALGLMLRPRKR